MLYLVNVLALEPSFIWGLKFYLWFKMVFLLTLNVIKWGLTWWLSGEESACQSNRDIDKEQTCGHSEERRRWDKLGEQHENICITLCKTDSQWEFAVWLRTSNLVLCDNLEDWDGMGGEREVQEGRDICIPMADSCWCMAETNTMLKQLSSN